MYLSLFLDSKESESFNDDQTFPIVPPSDDENNELVTSNTHKEMVWKHIFFVVWPKQVISDAWCTDIKSDDSELHFTACKRS